MLSAEDDATGGRMDQGHEPTGLFPLRVGERLADARRSQKLELADIAMRTRIPQRHLEAIESGQNDALPPITYAVGFVRTYGEALGLDGPALARDFRAELGQSAIARHTPAPYEPADPARVPSRLLALIALAIAVLIAGGYGLWRSGALTDGDAEYRARLAAGTLPEQANPAPAPAPAAATALAPTATPSPNAPVVLTATDVVWLRVYEAGGEKLLEKEMAPGESWTVPPTAKDPQILTGRPQALRVAVGNSVIPALGPPEQTIRDVSLKPAALIARASAPSAETPVVATPAAPPPMPTLP